MASVTLENIVKHYAPPIGAPTGPQPAALENINLQIADGETVSIVGPSGCGKSTLLKLIAGLEYADTGRIVFNAIEVTRVSPQDRGVGMVFQDYALYPSKEGQSNMAYYFEVHKRSEEEKQQRLREVAELMGVGFDVLMGQKVDTLSGGEKQRVGIARCIVREPSVFLMDEPISNLDAKLRERTRTEIRRLLKKFGITALYVTHDQQEAIFMGDRIVVMRAGRVEQFGTFDELYYSPANLFVATLIGTPPMSVVPVRVEAGRIKRVGELEIDWALPAELAEKIPAGAVRLGVRPENWHVSQTANAGAPLTVTRVERLFTERAAFANGLWGRALVNALVPLDFPDAQRIWLTPDWAQACFFAADSETALHTPGAPELF